MASGQNQAIAVERDVAVDRLQRKVRRLEGLLAVQIDQNKQLEGTLAAAKFEAMELRTLLRKLWERKAPAQVPPYGNYLVYLHPQDSHKISKALGDVQSDEGQEEEDDAVDTAA